MENPEKLSTQVTQNKEKQNKNTTQYVGGRSELAERRMIISQLWDKYHTYTN